MKIGIIGAGFTGLSAAYQLAKKGHSVTVFEKDAYPGGLAVGYHVASWNFSLEKHYHHWFTNDHHVLDLAKEIDYPVVIQRPKTSVYTNNQIFQLDSPLNLLKFPKLSLIERLRMAAVLGLLKFNPFWKPLEKVRVTDVLPKAMGEKGYRMLWEPQLRNKFGQYMDEISLAWFWARITKRTSSLAYPEKGFLAFANHLVKTIEDLDGKVIFKSEITSLNDGKKTTIEFKKENGKKQQEIFDAVIVTLPSFLFMQITPQLPDTYKKTLTKLKGLGATNLILRLSKPFFSDKTYWLSVCDSSSPITAIVEHTNFMDKKNYNNEHVVYLGNYLAPTDERFTLNKEQLLELYDPMLRKINPAYRKSLIDYDLFKAPFAQPIIPTNYSKKIPSFITPLPHVYLANIEQVYPWDRGTNYAVELGEKIADIILQSS